MPGAQPAGALTPTAGAGPAVGPFRSVLEACRCALRGAGERVARGISYNLVESELGQSSSAKHLLNPSTAPVENPCGGQTMRSRGSSALGEVAARVSAAAPPGSPSEAHSPGAAVASSRAAVPVSDSHPASERRLPGPGEACCRPAGEGSGVGPGWLVLLLPLACCGGPALVGALAAAGAATWGVLGGLVALVFGVVGVVLVRRRAARP